MAIIEDLIVSEPGAFVGLHGGRVRVEYKTGKHQDAPLLHLRSVQILTRAASVSAAVLAACCEAGVPLYFLDSIEGHYASIVSSKLTTVIASKRAQIEALTNARGVEIAQALGAGKMRAQAVNLRYLARRQSGEVAEKLEQAAFELSGVATELDNWNAALVADIRMAMMGKEGHCARCYWEAVAPLFPAEYGWKGRTGHHATDPINILLNYGYGILYGEVQTALIVAGLDPFAGLIHTDRPGKPSLTCDLIEEFRAPIVDRTVIGLAARHFVVELDTAGRLTRECRRAFTEHILSRLKAQGVYGRKRYELRSIIQMQARRLAGSFRGDQVYEAYIGG